MTAELRKIVSTFIRKMEDVNDKKMDATFREVNFAMREVEAFNEFRQSLLIFDKIELKEELSKRDKDVQELRKSQEDLIDKVQELEDMIKKKELEGIQEEEVSDGIPKDK